MNTLDFIYRLFHIPDLLTLVVLIPPRHHVLANCANSSTNNVNSFVDYYNTFANYIDTSTNYANKSNDCANAFDD